MIRNLDNFSGKILMYPRKPKRKNTQVPQPSGSTKNVINEAVYKELDDRLVRAATTASRLEVEQDSDKQSLCEDASKQERKINDIDTDEDITLVNVQDDTEMFDVNDLHGEELFVKKEFSDKEVNDEVQKVVKEVVEDTNTAKLIIDAAQVSVGGKVNTASIATTISQDKGKAIMIKEPMKPKKKDQIRLDEEAALKLQVELQTEFDEEQRIAREKTANRGTRIVNNKRKGYMFKELLDKRRKHFAAKAEEEKRNKPPTITQQRKIMCIYLKNVEGKKLKDFKNKSFNFIQKMFDRAFNRVNIIIDFRTELVKGSSKRAGEELTQESTKKQKVDDDKETAELKQLIKIILNEEEVAIDAIPLAVKSPKIVD
nr:hypothetical protein [Tanacetum cinerariifolium]